MSDYDRVHAALADIYRPEAEALDLWMRSRNPMLDHRTPNDLIAAGETERVLELIGIAARMTFRLTERDVEHLTGLLGDDEDGGGSVP